MITIPKLESKVKIESIFDGKKIISLLFHNHKSVKYYTGSVLWDIFCHKINCLSMKLKSWLFNLNFRENKVQNKDQIWKYVNPDLHSCLFYTWKTSKVWRAHTITNIQLNKYPQNIWMNLNKSFWLEFLFAFRINSDSFKAIHSFGFIRQKSKITSLAIFSPKLINRF